MTILIVDDKEENRYLQEVILKGNGFDVESCGNGAEAFERLKSGGIELIISDILMPVMDGLELCRKVKTDQSLYHIPFIIYTATYTGPKDEELAIKFGADRFIIKPCEPDAFMEAVRNTMAAPKHCEIGSTAETEPQDEILKLYNERLVRKLEIKMLELEKEAQKRREAEALLRKSEAQLKEAQRMAKLGSWEYDLLTERISWSDEIFRIFEIDREHFGASYDTFLSAIHPQDRDAVNFAYTQSLTNRTPYKITHRLLMPDGRIKYVIEQCETYYNPEGKPVRSIGTVQDVTERTEAEQALMESEEKFSLAFRNSPEAIGITRLEDGKFIEVNDAFVSITGYAREEALNNSSIGLKLWVDEKDGNRVLNDFLNGRKVSRQEIQIRKKNGEILTGLFSSGIIRIKNEQILLSNFTDITERKRVETMLRESEERYRHLFENSVMGISQSFPDGRLLQVNAAYAKMFGYANPEQMLAEVNHIGRRLYANPEDREKILQILNEKGVIEPLELAVFRRDGSQFWILGSAKSIRNAQGNLLCYQSECIDITKRKQAENALRESQKKYQNIIEKSEDIIWTADLNLHNTYVSPSIERKLGFTPEERMAQGLDTQLTPSSYKTVMDVLDQELKREKDENADPNRIVRIEVEHFHKNGSTLWFDLVASGLRDKNGVLTGIQGISRDITERKQAENLIKESEEKYRLLAENVSDVIYKIKIENEQCTYASPSAERLFGYTTKEILSLKVQDLLPSESYRKQQKDLIEALEKGQRDPKTLEFEVIHKDGHRVAVEAKASIIFNEQGNPVEILGVARDITERKLIQDQLKTSEEKYRSLVDNIAIGISLISPDMEILTINNHMKKANPNIDVSKRPICYRTFNNPPGDRACSYCPVIKTFQDGKVHQSVTSTPAGDEIKHIRIISSPIKDDQGKVVAAIEMVDDITEQKRSEEYIQNLSHMLLNAQENERQMISRELHDSVAQDLATLKISLETLFSKELSIPDEIRQKISGSSKLLQRAVSTVRNLSYDLRPMELIELGLIQTLSTYCEEFSRHTGIEVDFRPAGMQQSALNAFTEINLYRLIQEALSNVRKHAEAGRVTIWLVNSYPDIILRIQDNGKGFDVKKQESGSNGKRNMGLRSMKERVYMLQGQMNIQSYPMKGTEIFIKFPIKEDQNGL